ncbi:peptidase M24, structural domain-containing protein [Zychaea mexicana]|uniref:peptidase M24, structural domain-containing protein n=1 Tax=Zychaea mexicana TaxID=64656 RepID=UPI0022FEEB11|nr:peptidase M24, structural domain-containing protein [Zychaea mexicana]KAI9496791.1 peptidase M24, structural domain-containing protein [Zychaea mexicana]
MASQEEITPLVGQHQQYASQNRHWGKVKKKTMLMRSMLALSLLFALAGGVWALQHLFHQSPITKKPLPDFSSLRGYCAHTQAIQPNEYIKRQKKLAATLPESSAYVMEGGPTMLYYTNIAWGLSERPFLVVLVADASQPGGIKTTVVTPMFEATRAVEAVKDANLPDEIQPDIVEWIEHGSPYTVTADQVLANISTVFVEPTTRLFIFDGLSQVLENGVNGQGKGVQVASRALQTLRMVKSPAELNILRCVNHATEEAIRQVRPHVNVGMTESDIATLMTRALTTAGLTNTWVLALVDENAAFPHGEPGTTKKVGKDSTVLIDTGGELLGYQSDTTRTFFLGNREDHNQTIVDAWYLVKRAQKNVLDLGHAGSSCAEIDLSARRIITTAGYGRYFTHRLGHGLGMEMHEEPYMNQGNTDQALEVGMTFSVEPGIYVPREFGIRLEDIVVVNEEGQLEVLTSGLADNPWTLRDE